MSYSDQKKYFEFLKRHERKFDKEELKSYIMLKKRHRDDEYLDKLSLDKLRSLYKKYHQSTEKKNFDHFFKNTNKD